jgi:hypothetical protein
VGDDANKTKRLWEMLSPALEWADDITLIEVMARTMGRLVKSGGAMASDIVDLEVGMAQWGGCQARRSEGGAINRMLWMMVDEVWVVKRSMC